MGPSPAGAHDDDDNDDNDDNDDDNSACCRSTWSDVRQSKRSDDLFGAFLLVLVSEQTFGKTIKLQLHHFTHLRDQTDVFTRPGELICGSVAHSCKAVRNLQATAFDAGHTGVFIF